MLTNYDASQVGVIRARVPQITIIFPVIGAPVVTLTQVNAVTMQDGSTIELGPLPTLTQALDLVGSGGAAIQLVDFITGAPLTGQTTTLNALVIQILAVVRQIQTSSNP